MKAVNGETDDPAMKQQKLRLMDTVNCLNMQPNKI
jgi:hypothetical protein